MNDWMRQHQRIVFFFALLAILGTGFYGVLYMVRRPVGPGRGPGGWYFALDGRKISVEPEELYQERLLRAHLARRGEYYGEWALKDMARLRLARDMGFEVGSEELVNDLREDIKRRTVKEKVTEELLKNLLEELQMTRSQYERLLREFGTVQKVVEFFQGQARGTDGEQYLDYSQRKQTVRLFYKEFQAKDYEELAGDASPEDIKKYYDTHAKADPDEERMRRGPSPDSLETDPALSVDVLYFSKAFVTKDWKPADEELKKYYQENRNFYRVDTKPGDPIPTGDAAYKTFDEVKAKVLEDYCRLHMQTRANELKAGFEKEIAEEEKKAEEARQKFNLAAFAEKKGLTCWRTEKLKQRAFEKGSEKIKAPDFKLAGDRLLFSMIDKGASEQERKSYEEQRKKFSGATPILHSTDDDGFVMFRIAEFTAKELMTLEEATPIIKRRLREERAAKKALDAAVEFRKKWETGEAVPKLEELKDEVCSSTSAKPCRNPLYLSLSGDPSALGELLKVSFKDTDEELLKDRPDTRLGRYLVGFIAEREIPSMKSYEMDTVEGGGRLASTSRFAYLCRRHPYRGWEEAMPCPWCGGPTVQPAGQELAQEAHDMLYNYHLPEMEAGKEQPLNQRSGPTELPPDL